MSIRASMLCAVLLLLPISAMAVKTEPPISRASKVGALASVSIERLPAVDQARRLAEDAAVRTPGPLRYAMANSVSITPSNAGNWENVASGGRIWRYRFHAPGATDLNFGFTRYWLPRGAKLYVYSEEHDYSRGAYTAGDNKPHHRQLWTPAVPGDRAVVELFLPHESSKYELELTHVGAGYRDLFGLKGKPILAKQGACNVDTICPEGNNWRDEIRSVGMYSTGGAAFCTGTLMNDVPGSLTPFWLTANHCGITAVNAPSLVVIWNFESQNCGDLSGGVLTDTQSGATFLSAKDDVDFTLLQLDDIPDPSFNVFYSGWDATGTVPDSSVGISHPNNDEKALAFNDDALTTTNSCIGPVGIGNTHWNIDNYEQGMTEPGSSGSGLWNPFGVDPYNPTDKKLVGILSGGTAACNGTVPNNGFDCYGKLSVAWDSGATPDARVQDWLDPNNTGTLMVDGINPVATGVCGDSEPDFGEQCDDGNTANGDGCSSTCQVEAGFECTDAMAGGNVNLIPEGGFESGTPNPAWTEASTAFGTPLCNVANCGTGTGTGPNSGAWWTWFGGIAAVEDGSVEQSITINPADAEMTFAVEQILCDSGSDFARVLIDGNEVFYTDGNDPACGVLGYRTITIDLATAPGGPYNDGGAHTLRAESSTFAVNGSGSNFFFDDFSIDGGVLPPTPSVCTVLPESCYVETFDPGSGGLPAGWSSIAGPSDATNAPWGSTDDGICGSVNWPAGNYTDGAGEAACIDSDAAGAGITDAYLCSPAIDMSTVSGGELVFKYNFQVFSSTAEDLFDVVIGTTAPDAVSLPGYASLFSTTVDQGVFVGAGASETLDISGLDGQPTAHVCFRYSGDFDWYAQVDDVTVQAQSCSAGAPDTDDDGVTDDVDNCILVANPQQRDTDGDGIGNYCDADLNQDCQINFLDLGILKSVFFSNDPDADFDGNGAVNFLDLGIMKSTFFQAPGPSGQANICSNGI